jgi:hypothetical protein
MENQSVKSPKKKVTRAPRLKTAFPVRLGGATGITRDISATGVYLEMPIGQQLGDQVDLEIELDTPAGKRKLKLAGKVVRVEQNNDRIGLAIQVTE